MNSFSGCTGLIEMTSDPLNRYGTVSGPTAVTAARPLTTDVITHSPPTPGAPAPATLSVDPTSVWLKSGVAARHSFSGVLGASVKVALESNCSPTEPPTRSHTILVTSV